MAGIIGFTQSSVVFAGTQAAVNDTVNAGGQDTSLQSLGKSANAYGKELADKAVNAKPTFNGTGFSFQYNGETFEVNKENLAPKAGGSLKYKYSQEDIDKNADISTDAKEIQAAGMGAMDNLNTETTEESELTLEAQVYEIMSSMAAKPRADYSEAEFLKRTQEVMDDLQNVIKEIVSCDAKSALDKKTTTTHIADLKQCQQVVDRSMTCNVDHNYTAGVVEHSDGPFNIKSCGEGCTTVWLGNPADQNYYAGKNECRLYEYTMSIRLINPAAIQSVELTDIYWDDQMQVYFGAAGQPEVKWLQLPYAETFVPQYDEHPDVAPVFTYPGPFSGAAHTSCQQKWSWSWKTSLDVTNYFKNAKNGSVYNFRIRTAVQDKGEGYARLVIHWDPTKIVDNDIWVPKDCMDAALAIQDGMAGGTIKCTSMPDRDSDGCAWISGAKICPGALSESPLPGVPNLCRKVEITSNFNFYKGDTGCWKALVGFDKNGKAIYEDVCGGENLGGNLDTCKKYEDDKKCVFVKSECTPGMQGASGTCYVNDVVYDCGTDVKVEDLTADTTYACKGITCVGEECIDVERTYNTDFARINALLNAMQYMAQDMSCDGLDEDGNPIGDQNVVCSVFKGKPGTCKIAVGGWQDCCENPQNAGVGSYIKMMLNAQAAHTATISVAENVSTAGEGFALADQMAGQYAQMWKGVSDVAGSVMKAGVEYLKNNFSSVMDNIYSFSDYASTAIKWLKDQVIEELKKYLEEQLKSIMQELGLDGLLGGGTGAGGATGEVMISEGVKQAAGYVMAFVAWVYLAYQIANLVIQIVYKCEEEEYEMMSKRDSGNCHYIGSYCDQKTMGFCILKKRAYCCYDSPLSRIISEQVRLTQPEVLEPYGVSTFGKPEDPRCAGIPIEAVDKINWDLINLDEWTALLTSTGNSTAADVTLENLTGAGSKLNWTETRGRVDDWNPPATPGTSAVSARSTDRPMMMAMSVDDMVMLSDEANGRASGKSRTTRLNTVERIEDKLDGLDIDKFRNASAKCITLQIGNGINVRGGCAEESDNELVCRHNAALTDCEEIAYENSLGELLGNKPTSSDWYADGFRCLKDQVSIDCSSLYSTEAYIRALEEYARLVGGTTYLNRYVCVDKSGKYSSAVCQQAMLQNYCYCLPGDFRCFDGNKPIACAALGATKNNCACLVGACDTQCKYGGIPKGMEDNEVFVCNAKLCPYGYRNKDGVSIAGVATAKKAITAVNVSAESVPAADIPAVVNTVTNATGYPGRSDVWCSATSASLQCNYGYALP